MQLDEETREVAAHVLRNAFWYDFSKMVQAYIEAHGGTDAEVESQIMQMGDMTSVYGIATGKKPGFSFNVEITVQVGSSRCHKICKTIIEALEYPKASKVYLQGLLVATKQASGWYFPKI